MSQARRRSYKNFIFGAPRSRTTKRRHDSMNNSGLETKRDLKLLSEVQSSAINLSYGDISEDQTCNIELDNDLNEDYAFLLSSDCSVDNSDSDEPENQNKGSSPYEKDFLNEPVRPFLTVTKFEALLGILHFSISNNLHGVAIVELIDLINIILGEKDAIPATMYKIDKIFSNNLPYKVHYFCHKCFIYIGEKDKCDSVTQCHNCTEPFSFKNMNDKNYFISVSCRQQIQQVLEEDGVADMLSYPYKMPAPRDSIRDIFDGATYKKLETDGIVGPDIDSITLTFSCDGGAVFKNSKGSLWPIQFRINELPPKEKFLPHRLMVAGFWFGKHEPVPATYLKPFLDEINNFSSEPVKWTEPQTGTLHSTKVYLTYGIFDAPAKCLFQSLTQFNGYYSCPYCYHPGTLDKKQVRFDKSLHPLRTHNEVKHDMLKADTQGTKINGIKGLSPMILLKEFDLVNGYSIDYMHQTLLGVTKYLCTTWIDTSCHGEPFYLSRSCIDCIDERLLNIQPPSNISRAPRRFSECHMYKANEWRAWLLFYSIPCLQGVLTEQYLKHFSLLVSSIYILLKDSISEDELMYAEECLFKFIDKFQPLYSLSRMTFNLHQVTHLVAFVRQNGPLWANSMFPFESGLGFLLKFINGKTNVLSQLAKKYCSLFQMPKTIALYDGKNSEIIQYCDNLFSYPRLQKFKVFSSGTLLGAHKPFVASNEQLQAFQDAGLSPPENCICGQKVILNGMMLAVYKVGTLRNDSIVKMDNKYYQILNFMYYTTDDSCLYAIGKEIILNKKSYSISHIKICQSYHGKMTVFPVDKIICKSIIMKIKKICTNRKTLLSESNLYITDFPNFVEKD